MAPRVRGTMGGVQCDIERGVGCMCIMKDVIEVLYIRGRGE